MEPIGRIEPCVCNGLVSDGRGETSKNGDPKAYRLHDSQPVRERVAGLWTRRGLVKDSESVDEKDMMLEAQSMRRRRRYAYKVWKSE